MPRLRHDLEGPDLLGVGTPWPVQAPLYVGGTEVRGSGPCVPEAEAPVSVGQAGGGHTKKGSGREATAHPSLSWLLFLLLLH